MVSRLILIALGALLIVALAAVAVVSARSRSASAGVIIYGDVTCDGAVNAVDSLFILQLDAGLLSALPCPQNADVTGDGVINAVDALFILQFGAGMIDSLGPPAAEPATPTSTPPSSAPTPTAPQAPTPTATTAPTAAPTAPPATPTAAPVGNVSVSNSTWYVDSIGAIWVVGEVKNGLSNDIALVEITADFYSASDVLLATDFGFACLTAIPAGGDSSYSILAFAPPPGIDHVEISVTDFFEPPFFFLDPPVVGLDVVITNVYTDIIDFRHAVGTVTNNSSNTYDFVSPCVAFYDNAGNVIRTDFTFTSPTTLAPGGTGTFDAFVDAEGISITSERVWVDANYAK